MAGAKTTEHGPLPSPAVDHLLTVLNHENLVENLVELESTLSNEAKDSLPAIAIFGGLIGVFAIVAAFLLYRRHRTARELEAKYEPLDKKPVTRSSAPPPHSLVDSPTGDTHRISLPAAHVQLHAHAHAHRSSAASGMTLEHEPKPTEPKPDQVIRPIPRSCRHSDVAPNRRIDDPSARQAAAQKLAAGFAGRAVHRNSHRCLHFDGRRDAGSDEYPADPAA